MNAKDLRLDHFQIYDFEIPRNVINTTSTIRLKGQFDVNEDEFAKLLYLKKIGNPTQKNDEDVYNKDAHLLWYNMVSSDPRKAIAVKLENQFGGQKIVIYGVVGLLVPARKRMLLQPDSRWPKKVELDHYKVYRVVEHSDVESRSYELKDQFHQRKVTVGYPVAFAVPVSKVHGGEKTTIRNEKAHLTIYRVTCSKDMPQVVETRDQFGRYKYLKIGRSSLFAVPSVKHGWKAYD